MKRSTRNIVKILLIVCAVLCAALIVCQLVPYWEYQNTETGTTESISIFEYLGLPSSHKDVTKLLNSSSKEVINSLAGTFCFVLLGAVSIVFTIVKFNSLWVSIFPVIVGVGSLIGYLTEPRWQLGGMYIVLVVLSAALTVASLIPFGIALHSIKYWFMDPKELANK